MDSTSLPRGRFFSTTPSVPHEEPAAEQPKLAPVEPLPPRRPSPWLTSGLIALGLAILGAIAWNQRERLVRPQQGSGGTGIRTAAVYLGDFERRLRVSGTIGAKTFAAIRTPRMRAGREAGRAQLTLMNLADAGSIVKARDVVAEFEFKWLEDHLDDVRSTLTQSESDVEKRRAEIMIAFETEQQTLRQARADRDKAELDLRAAEVLSEIEAEIARLALEEAEAALKHKEQEVELQATANAADLRSKEIDVAKNRLHVERHLRDLEKMKTQTPVPGLVVMESIYKGGGQFDQVANGDEVFPGTFFMRVVDLSEMVVNGSVNQVDSQSVRTGQVAEVRLDAYPDLVLPGRVVSIGAMATSGGAGGFRWSRGSREDYVKQVQVEVAIEAEDERIIPDLSGSADILVSELENRLLIPRSAVRQQDDKTFVYLRQGEGFTSREIELGQMNSTQAVVLAGLQQGDEIVLGDIPKA